MASTTVSLTVMQMGERFCVIIYVRRSTNLLLSSRDIVLVRGHMQTVHNHDIESICDL